MTKLSRSQLLKVIIIAASLFMLAFLVKIRYTYLTLVDKYAYVYLSCKLNSSLMRAISFTASIEATTLYLVLLALRDVYRINDLSRELINLIASFVLVMFFVGVLKVVLKVPRPQETLLVSNVEVKLMEIDKYSFPSGHVARAGIIAHNLRSSRVLKVLLWTWVTIVMISRLSLGAHWLSDTIASIIVAMLTSELVKIEEDKVVKIYRWILKALRC